MCSYGMLPILLPVMTYVFWGASLENEWRKLFHRDLPRWLMVDDPSVLAEYYRGEASLYTTRNLTAWLPPLLWWSLVTFVLIFVMLCINIIVRRQWIEHEKHSYPIAEIPLNLVNSNFYSRLMWLGFAIAAGINLINGLHFLHPNLPALAFFKRKYIGYIFTEKPWSALRAMRISFILSIIGLSFFMPLNLLFSCWFFYFYWPGCVFWAQCWVGRHIRHMVDTPTSSRNQLGHTWPFWQSLFGVADGTFLKQSKSRLRHQHRIEWHGQGLFVAWAFSPSSAIGRGCHLMYR